MITKSASAHKITVRPIRANELSEARKVWSEAGLAFRLRGRDSLKNLRRQQKAAPDLFLGAFLRGKLVGVSVGTDDTRKGWINRLAVLPGARRKGIATALVRESEKALARRGHKLYCVLIEQHNRESMVFFEKLGYRKEDDILYYTKRISKSY